MSGFAFDYGDGKGLVYKDGTPAKKSKRKNKKRSSASKALTLAKQNKKLIMKTLELKQIEYKNTLLNVSSAGVRDGAFLQVSQGPADGSPVGGVATGARIGNKITLLRQMFNIHITQNPSGVLDDWNRCRILIVEALDGNQPILISDVLQYSNYATDNDLVFSSPYTTKTTTNRRYKVCFDKTFELNYRANAASRVMKYVKKWGKTGKVVDFNDNAAAPIDHQMTMLFISDSTSLPHPIVNYSVRSSYRDA